MHEEVPNVVRLALHLPGMHKKLYKQGFAIGRLYFADHTAGERFYLRLLLTKIRGPQSFDHLKTVNNITYPTFKDACIALGLLEDDNEWKQRLEEAAIMRSGAQLRLLFAVILIHSSPTILTTYG
ncbi:12608_t:CDS:2 [Dentiscutata heterogama]|uniref:12608_t:CDS:1 n=1 Tax=Dentiscutata heterogama TaxID=1316150 RepID=A0ACA9LMW9_9GLOM|nr:12608_t:CDS:2 [Dentiscutata heterogama]